MPRKKSQKIWFAHPCNPETRRVLVIDFNLRDFSDEVVEDFDETHQKNNENFELFKLHSSDEAQFLKKNKKTLGIKFKIFIQDSPGDRIYRCPHDH